MTKTIENKSIVLITELPLTGLKQAHGVYPNLGEAIIALNDYLYATYVKYDSQNMSMSLLKEIEGGDYMMEVYLIDKEGKAKSEELAFFLSLPEEKD